jgi:hypothetical protein
LPLAIDLVERYHVGVDAERLLEVPHERDATSSIAESACCRAGVEHAA